MENSPIGNSSKFKYLQAQAYYYSGKTEAGKKLWKIILATDPDMKACAVAVRNTKKVEE